MGKRGHRTIGRVKTFVPIELCGFAAATTRRKKKKSKIPTPIAQQNRTDKRAQESYDTNQQIYPPARTSKHPTDRHPSPPLPPTRFLISSKPSAFFPELEHALVPVVAAAFIAYALALSSPATWIRNFSRSNLASSGSVITKLGSAPIAAPREAEGAYKCSRPRKPWDCSTWPTEPWPV